MIVTLRLAEGKIKESQFQKGGVPPRLCRLVGSFAGASPSEREIPGARLRQIAARHNVAPLHLVAYLRQAYYIPGDLSTGYPQLIAMSY